MNDKDSDEVRRRAAEAATRAVEELRARMDDPSWRRKYDKREQPRKIERPHASVIGPTHIEPDLYFAAGDFFAYTPIVRREFVVYVGLSSAIAVAVSAISATLQAPGGQASTFSILAYLSPGILGILCLLLAVSLSSYRHKALIRGVTLLYLIEEYITTEPEHRQQVPDEKDLLLAMRHNLTLIRDTFVQSQDMREAEKSEELLIAVRRELGTFIATA
jgi:hypothetical protein